MLRPAYAVEYDYLPAHQCDPSLQTKRVAGLFFSGQLNGTTGADTAATCHDGLCTTAMLVQQHCIQCVFDGHCISIIKQTMIGCRRRSSDGHCISTIGASKQW